MISIIIKKELKRVFSDKKLVFSTFILPAISIFVIYSIMGNFINKSQSDFKTHTYEISIVNAPKDLQALLAQDYNNQFNVKYLDNNFNIENEQQLIKDGNQDLLVIFDGNFISTVENYQSTNEIPNILIYANTTKDYSSTSKRLFTHVLDDYKTKLLEIRFNGQDYVSVFSINENMNNWDLADNKEATGKALSNILPLLIALMLFGGAMGIGIDIIAGEKERGTLATMLLTPVKREVIAMGKIISLGILAILNTLSSFIGIVASLPFSSSFIAGSNGMGSFSINITQLLQLLVLLILLVMLYVGMICSVSIAANSVKEAGTYVSPLYIIVMVCGFASSFSTGTPENWKFLIPVFGNIAAIKNIFLFQLTMTQFIYCVISSLITASILIKIITMKFNDEKTLFSH